MRSRALVLVVTLTAALAAAPSPAPAGPAAVAVAATAVYTGQNPRGIAVDPTGSRVYVASRGTDDVRIVDGTLHAETHVAEVGSQPKGIAYNAATRRVYAASWFSGEVTVHEGNTLARVKTIDVGGFPHGVAANPITNKVYVASEGRQKETLETCSALPLGRLNVIDGATDEIVKTILVGRNPTGVAVNPETNRIYVTNYCDDASTGTDGTVSVIDGSTDQVIATVAIPRKPSVYCVCARAVAVNPATNMVYVATFLNSTIAVIDGRTNALVTQIDLPDPLGTTFNPAHGLIFDYGECSCPKGVAVSAATNRIYSANTYLGSVSVIDGFTNQVIGTFGAGAEPRTVAVAPTGIAGVDRVYVGGYRSHNLTVMLVAG